MNQKITSQEIDDVAALHLLPRLDSRKVRQPASKFRFYRDKVRLFLDFDPESVILKKNDEGLIEGVLIFTRDEAEFNRFMGPLKLCFYNHLLTTVFGYYGFDFRKFFLAARSATGFAGKSLIEKDAPSAKTAKIWALIVAEESRKKGIAGELIRKCIDRVSQAGGRCIELTVQKDNIPAIRAYEKSGFKVIGDCLESTGPSHIMQMTIS